jgi:hypothetical protein
MQMSSVDVKEIASLSSDINQMERDNVELIAEYLEMRVEGIVKDFNHPDEKSIGTGMHT